MRENTKKQLWRPNTHLMRKRIRERGGAQVTQVQLQLAALPCGVVCGCWPRNTRGCPPLMLFVRQLSMSFSTVRSAPYPYALLP